MKSFNLSKFVLRAGVVLIVSGVLFGSSFFPAWGDKLASYQLDLSSPEGASFARTSFATITNTSASANTITIKFRSSDATATETETVSAGSTWIFSSASELSGNKDISAGDFKSAQCVGNTAGNQFVYYPKVAFPVAFPATFAPFGFPMQAVSAGSPGNPFSLFFVGIKKNSQSGLFSGSAVECADSTGKELPSPIKKMDKKIVKNFVDVLNARHVADKDVRKAGEKILKTHPGISQLIQDRAMLYKKIVKQGGTSDTAGCGKLPENHTITVTVSREKGKKLCKDMDQIIYDDCETCISEGGSCKMEKQDDFGTRCYTCTKMVSQCRAPARNGTCPGTCDGNQLCVGGHGPCHMCMNVSRIEITYAIIIIETPFGRYVLDDKPGFGGFKASQVMALAKVDSLKGGLSSIAGMLGGGFGPLSVTGGTMDLQSMAQALSKGLNKGSKYGNNCFDKNFKEADLSGDVPPVYEPPRKKKKRRKKGAREEPEFIPEGSFGEDPMENISTGGPVVACGSVGKEKALAIMDAAGKPVDVIFRDQLKANPNAITEALLKAEGASQMVMSMRQKGIRSFLKNKTMSLREKLAKKVIKSIGNAIAEKGKVIPDDPFYKAKEKKKKKKLLGIFGSSKKAKVVLGSNMRVGNHILGAGTERTSGRNKFQAKDQWGLQKIGYTPLSDPHSAWNAVDFKTKNILVAVIDSGFDFSHLDAPQYTWTNKGEIPDNGIDDDYNGYVDDVKGWNFLDNNNDLTDKKGHGSFVAGIIAAKWNNGIGIAGINPGAVIMPVKVADKEGRTNSFDIFRAIHYAVDNGARVINISLGSRGVSQLERTALNYALARGVFVAIASGNVGENISGHGPASSKGGVAVGSIDHDGTRSTISNWGANNGLLAPGEEIYSLISTGTGHGLRRSIQELGYYPQSGTSFSAPMVAATASLLLVNNPDLTPEDIEDILQRTATDMYDPGWDDKSGAGLLNAAAALRHEFKEAVTVKIAEIRINRNKKKQIESVDIFGTVRGDFDYFVVELGKGKRAKKFKQVSKAFKKPASHDWLVRLIKKEHLRGSDEWRIRIKAVDQNSSEKIAEGLLELK